MRTEVPTTRGFDIEDPRLELRRIALLAQTGESNASGTSGNADRPTDDVQEKPERRDLELIGAGGRDGR
jgi:hypothetical protein